MPVPSSRAVRRLLDSEPGRFLLVGGVATGVDVGLFNLLHLGVGTDPVAAKALSTAVAAVLAFLGNRAWSFEHGGATPVGAQVVPYLAVTLAGLALALVPVVVARAAGLEGALAMNAAANLVGLGLATAFRYDGYRRWVFRAPEPPVLPVPERRAAGRSEDGRSSGLRRAA